MSILGFYTNMSWLVCHVKADLKSTLNQMRKPRLDLLTPCFTHKQQAKSHKWAFSQSSLVAPGLRAAGRCVTGIPCSVFPLVKAVNDVDRQQDSPSHYHVVHHTNINPTQRIYGAFKKVPTCERGRTRKQVKSPKRMSVRVRDAVWNTHPRWQIRPVRCQSRKIHREEMPFEVFVVFVAGLNAHAASVVRFSVLSSMEAQPDVFSVTDRRRCEARKNRRSGDAFRGHILNKNNQLPHLWEAKSSWLSGPLERCKRYLISIGFKIKGK